MEQYIQLADKYKLQDVECFFNYSGIKPKSPTQDVTRKRKESRL